MLNFYNKYKRYFLLFGAFIIQLTLGSFYTFGNNHVLIVNYMNNNSLENSSVNMRNSVWIMGMLFFGMGAAVSFGGYIEMKIGTAKTVLLGGWIMSLNVCLMYFTMKSYLAIVVVTYGLLSGIGIGMAYGVSLATPVKFFKRNKGLVIGLTISGFGLSPTIFNITEDYLFMKEENLNLENLPQLFVISGLIYAVIQLLGSLLLIKKSDMLGTTQNDVESRESISSQSVLYQRQQVEMKPHQIIFQSAFWIIWMIMFFHSTCINFIVSLYDRYANYLNLKQDFVFAHLTKMSIYHGMCNFLGRIFWGFIIDRKFYKKTMFIVFITNTILVSTLPLLSRLDDPWNYFGFVTWFGFIHFFFAGNYSIFPVICIELFGMKNFVCNYGLIYTACSGSGTIASLVIILISPESSVEIHIFIKVFILCGVMALFAAILTLFIRFESLNSELQ